MRTKPKIIDAIGTGFSGMSFGDISQNLLNVDPYMVLADFSDYKRAQIEASALYNDKERWNRMSLVNIANAGIFAADRSIEDYANRIWDIK